MTNSKHGLCGAHERHLLRRSNNPLFGNPQYTSDDLERARLLDQDELREFIVEVQSVVIHCLQLGETIETDEILQLKEQLDKLYERSCGLAGDLGREQKAIESVIVPIMNAIETNAATDPKAMQKLNDEKTARAMHIQLLKNTLICDLLRPDSTIGEMELPATLLTEPLASMTPVLDFFDEEQLTQLHTLANELIEKLTLGSEHPAHANLLAIQQHIKQRSV